MFMNDAHSFVMCMFLMNYSAEDTMVPARGKALVKTDLSIAIPQFTYARIGMIQQHFYCYIRFSCLFLSLYIGKVAIITILLGYGVWVLCLKTL